MSEFYRPSAEQYLSSVENRAYTELLAAQEAYDSLWLKIEAIYATSANSREAEKVILRTIAPQLDIARKEINRAYRDWRDSLDELHQVNTQ